MQDISLDIVAMEQLHGEQKALLDTIDELRKHGIGRFVDLPQIIVVGDQSSGKSSVLEAISRVRFPVKDGLCTRFATELVLRTSPQVHVDVRIQPCTTGHSEHQSFAFNETSFDKEELPRIVDLAKSRLLKGSNAFSEDILRVEICGPDVPHLTLVDLPGFYHSEDETQSAAGREVVDRLAERYMARKNSIILAIISARNQVVLQKVLSKVKLHDKNKERTLGIVTKPDVLVSGSEDEENFVQLAKNMNKSHQLSLGWHVLRNRGESEGSDSYEERDQKEQDFFASGVWSSVPSKYRGVDTLRKKLSSILLEHISNNLQGLIETIEAYIHDRQIQLKRLGEPRSTPKELRTHLDTIASQFQMLSLHSVEGNYTDEFFGGLYPESGAASVDDGRIRKLRALVRDLNRAFAYVLATKGSTRVIKLGDTNTFQSRVNLPPYLQTLALQFQSSDPEVVAFESIAAELEELSSANQGNEFPGTSNDRLAVKLFQDQSRPWETIAKRHLQLVLRATKSFVEKLVGHITSPDQGTCSAILSDVVDPFFDQKSDVLEAKLQELLYHFRSGYPQPLDAEFRSLLTSRRRGNLTTEVVQNLLASQPELFTEEARQKLTGVSTPQRTSEFGVESLIHKSETYYELSLRTFTDNVIVLAVENCLIRDLPTIFTTAKVSQMEDKELEQLASESPEIQVERTELRAEYEALKKGLALCNKYKSRKSTVIPSVFAEMGSVPPTATPGRLEFTAQLSSRSSTTSTPTKTPTKPAVASSNPPANGASSDQKASLPMFGTGQYTDGFPIRPLQTTDSVFFPSKKQQTASDGPANGKGLFGVPINSPPAPTYLFGASSSGTGDGYKASFAKPPGPSLFGSTKP